MSHDLSAENLLRLADEGDGDTLAALVDKALGSSARDTSASAAAAARAAALNFLAQDGRGTHGIEAVGAGRGFGGSDGAMGSGGAVSAGRGGLGLALGRRKFAAKPTKAAILRATLLEARSGDGSNIVHLAVGQKLGGETTVLRYPRAEPNLTMCSMLRRCNISRLVGLPRCGAPRRVAGRH